MKKFLIAAVVSFAFCAIGYGQSTDIAGKDGGAGHATSLGLSGTYAEEIQGVISHVKVLKNADDKEIGRILVIGAKEVRVNPGDRPWFDAGKGQPKIKGIADLFRGETVYIKLEHKPKGDGTASPIGVPKTIRLVLQPHPPEAEDLAEVELVKAAGK